MRVLTVGNMYPPHHLGGYELIWRGSVEYLRARGATVRILTTDFHRPGLGDEGDGPSDVHRELGWYWRDHGWPRMSPRRRLALERRNARLLERHLSEFRPDVVGWWAMGGMSLSMIEQVRRAGIPAAGFLCDEWLVYGPFVDAWLRMNRRRVLGAAAERLTGIPTSVRFSEVGPWLFLSEMLRGEAVATHGLERTAVAHRGVDPAVFTKAGRPRWRWRLLYVGRIDRRKGIDLAIEALAGLPAEARLEVVGSGDEAHLEELRSLAARLGVADRVRFRPAESGERLRERYADADVVLFPVRWREPWGLVPLEAMSVGAPVVASGRGGSAEYLRDEENCLVVDPDEGPGALADAVTRLSEDAALRERLLEGGFACSNRITLESFDRSVEATFEQALTGADRR